jgi:hypothetical protein
MEEQHLKVTYYSSFESISWNEQRQSPREVLKWNFFPA